MFCNNQVTGSLHSMMTKEMNENIRIAAELINDADITLMFSHGDLIAQEAHYRKMCHTRFLNRRRTAKAESKQVPCNPPDINASLAFAEIVTFIEPNKCDIHELLNLPAIAFSPQMPGCGSDLSWICIY